MEVRKVTLADDIAAISRIYALSWKAAYKGIVPQGYLDELPLTHWVGLLSSGPWESFVLVDDGKYAGTASFCPARDESMSGWGEIISIYLLPEHFGRGYGKLLLDAAVSELKKYGFNAVYLWVLEENLTARRFYERNGFKEALDKISVDIGGKSLTELKYIRRI